MKKQGFTIVELVIYMGLLTILIAILTRLFTAITDVQLSSEATGAVEEDSRYIYTRLAYDLTRADSVVTPSSAGVTSNSLTIMIGGVANTYSISGTNLMLANGAGVMQINSYGSMITNLSFTMLGPTTGKESVKVDYVLTSTAQSAAGSETKSVETTVALR